MINVNDNLWLGGPNRYFSYNQYEKWWKTQLSQKITCVIVQDSREKQKQVELDSGKIFECEARVQLEEESERGEDYAI